MKDNKNIEQTKISKNLFTEWLEQLQQESWQLELLISGFAIFGVYSARPFINEIDISSSLQYTDNIGAMVSMAVGILKNGWFIFFVNLIVHVTFRGLWIGAIGLRYVSNEIEYDKLGYSDLFRNFLIKRVGSYDDYIERLEKLCSVIFAFTFLLFLLFCSFSLYFGELLLLGQIAMKVFGQQSLITNGIVLIFLGLGFLVFIDFITLGGLKKIKETVISKPYFYIYRFFSIITLSFLYRPLLYNFIDNSYTRRLFYFSIPYIFLMLFANDLFNNSPNPYVPPTKVMSQFGLIIDDNYYDDRRVLLLNEFPNEDRKINRKSVPSISLESFEVNKQISSFFILLRSGYDKVIAKDSLTSPYYKEGVSFSLFGKNKVEDDSLSILKDNKSKILKPMYAENRKRKKQLRKDKVNIALENEIAQVSHDIDSLTDVWKSRLENYSATKAKKSISTYLDLVEVAIDGEAVSLENCFYHKHPNFGELGIKCFYSTDSLTSGIHKFSINQRFLNREKLDSSEVILPFLMLK